MRNYMAVFLSFGLVLFVIIGRKLWQSRITSILENNSKFAGRLGPCNRALVKETPLLSKTMKTANGTKTYLELFETAYRKLNYSLCLNQQCKLDPSNTLSSFLPISKLNQSCDEIFSEWMSKNNAPSTSRKEKPPAEIPKELLNLFTIDGLVPVRPWYFNEVFNDPNMEPLKWTKASVDEYLKKVHNGDWNSLAYEGDGLNLNTAMQNYPPRGRGLIIGSLTPWVEAICLYNGATNLTTAEYHPIDSTHPQLATIHPVDLAKNYKKYLASFDFAASFSSIEHSGLGRFGDNLDPNGDLLEMGKVWCFLKPGALFYLSIPVGTDVLFWNAGRFYGHLRYPMMAADFDILGIFHGESSVDLRIINGSIGEHTQPVAVLKKNTKRSCFFRF